MMLSSQRETNWCLSSHCLVLKASFVQFIFLPADTILWTLLSQSLIFILYTDTVYLVVHLFTYAVFHILRYTSCSGKQKEHTYVSERFKANICAKISFLRRGLKQNDCMQNIIGPPVEYEWVCEVCGENIIYVTESRALWLAIIRIDTDWHDCEETTSSLHSKYKCFWIALVGTPKT